MFDEGDAEKLSNLGDLVPDGVFDASNYARILSNVFESMVKMEDEDNPTHRIQFMMDCINECSEHRSSDGDFSTENVSDVVTALSYFVMNLYSYLNPEQKHAFYNYHKNHAIPQTFRECEAMPFYEIENMFPND